MDQGIIPMPRPFLLSEQELADVEYIVADLTDQIKKYLTTMPVSINFSRQHEGRLSFELRVADLPETIAALTHRAIRGVQASLNAMAVEIAHMRGDYMSNPVFPFELLSAENFSDANRWAPKDEGHALALLRGIVASFKGGSGLSLIPKIDQEHSLGTSRIVPSVSNVVVQGSYDLIDPAIGDIKLVSYDITFAFDHSSCLAGHNLIDYIGAVSKAAGLIVIAFQRSVVDDRPEGTGGRRPT